MIDKIVYVSKIYDTMDEAKKACELELPKLKAKGLLWSQCECYPVTDVLWWIFTYRVGYRYNVVVKNG